MAQRYDLAEINPGSLQDVPQAQLASRRGNDLTSTSLTSTSHALGSADGGELQVGRWWCTRIYDLGQHRPARPGDMINNDRPCHTTCHTATTRNVEAGPLMRGTSREGLQDQLVPRMSLHLSHRDEQRD